MSKKTTFLSYTGKKMKIGQTRSKRSGFFTEMTSLGQAPHITIRRMKQLDIIKPKRSR